MSKRGLHLIDSELLVLSTVRVVSQESRAILRIAPTKIKRRLILNIAESGTNVSRHFTKQCYLDDLLDDLMVQVIDSCTLDFPMRICICDVLPYLAANVLPVALSIVSDCVEVYGKGEQTF